MKKMIFFDIDGTLWDEKMVIPESTRAAIAKLKEKGHMTFICSGRSRSSIQDPKLLSLGFDGIVGSCGNYIEMDGKVLYNNVLTPEATDKLIRTLTACHMPVVLEGPLDCWIDEVGFEGDPYVDYLYDMLGERAHPLSKNWKDQELEVNKFDIVINKCSADVMAYTDYDRVKKELGDEWDFIEHEGINVVEMIPKGTSKATGIDWLCKHFNIPVSETYAVGDSVNDLDMLKFVGHSIGMGNGVSRVKEIVEYVTADIHEDGIYKAMEHYGLI